MGLTGTPGELLCNFTNAENQIISSLLFTRTAPAELHTTSHSTSPAEKTVSNIIQLNFILRPQRQVLRIIIVCLVKCPSQATNDSGDGNLEPPSGAPKSEDSISRGAITGMASVLALSLTAACIVYTGSSPSKYSSKDANHFGIAAHERWGR